MKVTNEKEPVSLAKLTNAHGLEFLHLGLNFVAKGLGDNGRVHLDTFCWRRLNRGRHEMR